MKNVNWAFAEAFITVHYCNWNSRLVSVRVYYFVKFHYLSDWKIKIVVFWDVVPCGTKQHCVTSQKAIILVLIGMRTWNFMWLKNVDKQIFTLFQSWLWLGYLSDRCCKGPYRNKQLQVPGSSDIWWSLPAPYVPHSRSLASSSFVSCILWDL